ncbi:MAG: hypothetical protein IIA81_03375 [Thaumarchaeota archaeon]|nr:hypothetical protein [Nitrososphaerota archaeon]
MKIAFGIASLIVIFFISYVFGNESAGFEDQDSNDEIRFSGFIGPLINCETFSYEIPITVRSQSSVPIIIEIIDPDGNVAGRDEFKSDNYERNRIIEMNWGKDGRYLIQVHYKGEIYQEDFSHSITPETFEGHRMGCLKEQYIKSVKETTWTWFNWPDHTQDGFDKNIKTAEELIRESNEPFWLSFVSGENINNMIQGEPPIHDTSTSFSKRNELKSILFNGIEQKVIKIFQDSENKLLNIQFISLDQKTDLIFELRAERDQQVINQKAYAEKYVENLYRLYASVKASQDYMEQYIELVNQINLQEKEKELQIAKEKESIKQEILSQKQSKIPEWVKNNVKWWSENQIDDETFVSGIQFLMKEKIVNIPNLPEQASEKARLSFVDESKDTQSYIDRYNNEPDYKDWFDENYPDYTIYEAVGVTEPVPRWIKNNADWWSQGLITEDDFIKGIEFLVEKRILKVN